MPHSQLVCLTLGAHARGLLYLSCVSVCYRSSGYSIRLYLQSTTPMGFSWALLDFKRVEFQENLPFKSYGVKKPICK